MIIADSSPLIALATIGKLDLLEKLFREVIVPYSVYEEVIHNNKPYCTELKSFLVDKVKQAQNKVAVEILLSDIGKGESEAIVLAIEEKADFVLVDDLKARKLAKMNGLDIIGTMGLLLEGKNRGLVTTIKPLIEVLLENNIRISEKVVSLTLNAAGE